MHVCHSEKLGNRHFQAENLGRPESRFGHVSSDVEAHVRFIPVTSLQVYTGDDSEFQCRGHVEVSFSSDSLIPVNFADFDLCR